MSAADSPDRTLVLLDCDPGHDDALAIILALARPELRLLGITTVAGNATLPRTTENTLRLLTLLGRTDVLVASGAARPLERELQTAAHVHGSSGLGGADLPEPAVSAVSDDAVTFMAELIVSANAPVTLIPTGPLTNVAELLRRRPQAAGRLKRICLMGGAAGEGNITPLAEFNIWVDPEAAEIVFAAGLPVTMIGLDVTHQAQVTAAEAESFRALDSRTGAIVADLLAFFGRFHRERYGWDGSPIHDAVAVAHALDLGLVETVPAHVSVRTDDAERGRTVVDLDASPNAEVGVAIDRPRFVDLLRDALATFP